MKRKYKVLVVDDEDDIRMLVNSALLDAGFEVREAANGKEALEKIKSKKPDLVLLDVMMPDMNGWEVCKQIKENDSTRDVIVSMLTVKVRDPDKVKSFDYALADWHIPKPVDMLELPKTVQWLLEKPLKRAGR